MDSETLIVILIVIGVIVIRVRSNITAKKIGSQIQFGEYGLFGGVVCPNCDLPYGLTVGKLNLGFGSYARCPHCQKWRVARRANPDALAEAETRLGGQENAGKEKPEMSKEERLYKDLDASKYND